LHVIHCEIKRAIADRANPFAVLAVLYPSLNRTITWPSSDQLQADPTLLGHLAETATRTGAMLGQALRQIASTAHVVLASVIVRDGSVKVD